MGRGRLGGRGLGRRRLSAGRLGRGRSGGRGLGRRWLSAGRSGRHRSGRRGLSAGRLGRHWLGSRRVGGRRLTCRRGGCLARAGGDRSDQYLDRPAPVADGHGDRRPDMRRRRRGGYAGRGGDAGRSGRGHWSGRRRCCHRRPRGRSLRGGGRRARYGTRRDNALRPRCGSSEGRFQDRRWGVVDRNDSCCPPARTARVFTGSGGNRGPLDQNRLQNERRLGGSGDLVSPETTRARAQLVLRS